MITTGSMHMHSTHSYDGKVPLSELKELLKAKGISFACMTEHTDKLTEDSAKLFVDECRALTDETFVFVPGFEVPYKDAHILMIGAEQFVCQFAERATLLEWKQVAQLAVLAHPVRNKFKVDDTMLEVIDGVEIWNQQYEGKRVARPRSYKLLEILRDQKIPLFATGGLDLHRAEHLTYPRVRLSIDTLTEENILESLKNGAFTFGSKTIEIEALGKWQSSRSIKIRIRSMFSIFVITLGKLVNKTLASLGLSLPKGLKRMVRSRV